MGDTVLRDYPEEIEKTKTLYKKLGRVIPTKFPKWSITEVVYFEDESDTIKLAEKMRVLLLINICLLFSLKL